MCTVHTLRLCQDNSQGNDDAGKALRHKHTVCLNSPDEPNILWDSNVAHQQLQRTTGARKGPHWPGFFGPRPCAVHDRAPAARFTHGADTPSCCAHAIASGYLQQRASKQLGRAWKIGEFYGSSLPPQHPLPNLEFATSFETPTIVSTGVGYFIHTDGCCAGFLNWSIRGRTLRPACAVQAVGGFGPVGKGDCGNQCVPIHRAAPNS